MIVVRAHMEGSKMLVLSRKLNQRILIGDDIVITIVDLDFGKVRVGVDAPANVRVDREEVAIKKGLKTPPTEKGESC